MKCVTKFIMFNMRFCKNTFQVVAPKLSMCFKISFHGPLLVASYSSSIREPSMINYTTNYRIGPRSYGMWRHVTG